MRRALALLLTAPVVAQGLAPEDAKVHELSKAKNWAALADFIETLNPKERGRHLMAWMNALHRAGRHERAILVCDAVLGQLKDPRDLQLIMAHEIKARSFSAQGMNPEAALAWETLGLLPGQEHQLDNAIVEARNARDWQTMERIARVRAEKGPDPNEGDRPLASLPLSPPRAPHVVPGQGPVTMSVMKAEAKGCLGEALARQDRFGEAEPILREALATQPKQPFAWSNLARCLNEKKAFEEAFDACDQALALDPRLVEALFNRGRAAFELKRYPKAVEDFRAALALLPNDAVLKENLRQAERYANPRGKKANL